MVRAKLFLAISLMTLVPVVSAADDALIETMREYMEFAEYAEGSITPEQVAELGLRQFHVVDTRRAEQYREDHIQGAVNIEWRQILGHRQDLPKDRTLLLYCETGLLSARAHMALRLAGFDRVKVLFGGFNGWRAYSSIQP